MESFVSIGEAAWVMGVSITTLRRWEAAINLKNMAMSFTASACGKEAAGHHLATAVKPASMKQAVSFDPV